MIKREDKIMKRNTYIQPQTMATQIATTAALLIGSVPDPDYNIGIGGGGDPGDGR
jgi:hypothetical protein